MSVCERVCVKERGDRERQRVCVGEHVSACVGVSSGETVSTPAVHSVTQGEPTQLDPPPAAGFRPRSAGLGLDYLQPLSPADLTCQDGRDACQPRFRVPGPAQLEPGTQRC